MSGYRCWCGAQTFVLRTDGNTRRRECFNQHRFTTEETVKQKTKKTVFKPTKKDWLSCYNELKVADWDLEKAMRAVDGKTYPPKGKYGFKKGGK